MEDYEPETELEENIQQSYNISLLDEDYDLSMNINPLASSSAGAPALKYGYVN